MKKVKVGDIIRMTKLRRKFFDVDVMASVEHPAYFKIVSGDDVGTDELRAQLLSAPCDEKYFSMEWAIANSKENRKAWGDGVYKVLSDDEVPDHVWAEIARRALLGEANE